MMFVPVENDPNERRTLFRLNFLFIPAVLPLLIPCYDCSSKPFSQWLCEHGCDPSRLEAVFPYPNL
jgi:hypothetical protein